MSKSFKSKAWSAVTVAIAVVPWLMSMYVFYWLDSSGTWTSETPHRGKMSVALLGVGMLSSFLVHSYFANRRQERSGNRST